MNNEEQKPNQNILDLFKDVPVIGTTPVDPPKQKTSIMLYDDGSEQRLYLYFNGAWRYVVLT
jgi:hypothetical protein